ncbi:hypothetical protein Sjap_023611 [Stephania japonica]|uniref:Response regulatory domain-containing protein n=1 Tax=Stephania japonica TaxID=461633 RepID=A0AAP0HKM8_9MAGN
MRRKHTSQKVHCTGTGRQKMHRMIHKKLLATLGVESQEAENGKEVVDICLSGEGFNLILMEYDMPVMLEQSKNVTVDETETYFTKKLTALVVDDSKMHRMINNKLLATLGVESQEAENGKEVVDICLSGEGFNLILVEYDIHVMLEQSEKQ